MKTVCFWALPIVMWRLKKKKKELTGIGLLTSAGVSAELNLQFNLAPSLQLFDYSACFVLESLFPLIRTQLSTEWAMNEPKAHWVVNYWGFTTAENIFKYYGIAPSRNFLSPVIIISASRVLLKTCCWEAFVMIMSQCYTFVTQRTVQVVS